MGDKTTHCGLHFAVVSDKLDLSSTERRLDAENIIFSVLDSNGCENCAPFKFSTTDRLSTFLCFTRGVSEEHFTLF